jgi:hypothetical protein
MEWHSSFLYFFLMIFLGSDSILGEYPVANSLFLENKIAKKEIKFFWPKIMTICL